MTPPSIKFRSGRLLNTVGYAISLLMAAWPSEATAVSQLSDYNLVWESPSANASESMPVGGGDIGLNVWVENGDLLLYLARSGAIDEKFMFLKLGRLRVTLSPNPFAEGATFRQELKLKEGYIDLHGEKDGVATTVRVWVDVARPVAHIEVQANQPVEASASYENWRQLWRTRRGWTPESLYAGGTDPIHGKIQPDAVGFEGNAVRFVHRNEGYNEMDRAIEQQGLQTVRDRMWRPLENLTFGGAFWGDGFHPAGTKTGRYASTDFTAWHLQSDRARTSHRLSVALHVATTPTLQAWDAGLSEIRREADTVFDAAEKTRAWWAQFWERSHVYINPGRPATDRPWQIGRNYQVFRYQLGCNARGNFPTKFNGGLFTFDPEFVTPNWKGSPDERRWGGGIFTAQNQRLVYWPMLKSGDADLMRPQFDFYRRALVNAEIRSEVYWTIKGASFTEQMDFYGLPTADYYLSMPGQNNERGVDQNRYIEYMWDTSLEFCQMILDTRDYAGADIREYLPLVESCVRFFDEYYRQKALYSTGSPLSKEGKLILFPGSACESYKGNVLNATPTIAALRRVLMTMVKLPDDVLPVERKAHWEAMLNTLPDLAVGEKNGHRQLLPAWKYDEKRNCELPQLYPVYPWGSYGVGRPDLDIAINTFKHGIDAPDQDGYVSWHQNGIFAARLGLTKEAGELAIKKMADSDRRCPTFWGPGHDWGPDHNWGGTGMIAVQEMLVQAVDEKIYLLPAWPKEWDVDFKLHLPRQTTVECVYQGGKLQRLSVTPESRRADIILPTAD
jgi:Domain of unknown function (DUF5703)